MRNHEKLIGQIDTPLVSSGVMVVATQQPVPPNAHITLEEAARKTRQLNSLAELNSRFVTTEGGPVPHLLRKFLPSGSMVETIQPTAAYSPGGTMVLAIPKEILDGTAGEEADGRLRTLSIFDLSIDAQIEYYHQIIQNIHVLEQAFGMGGDELVGVMATENAVATVSNERYRTARTVTLPHSHVFLPMNDLRPLEPALVHRSLFFEKNMLQLMNEPIVNRLRRFRAELQSAGVPVPQLAHRVVEPVGYVMTTNVQFDDPTLNQANRVQALLALHHREYTTAARELVEEATKEQSHPLLRNKLLPQPSYKVYMTYTNTGYLEISIAPTLFTQTGAVEALNRAMYRSPDAPSFFTDDEAQRLFYAQVSASLRKLE